LHFDPLSYHNGSIWPHDTAMLAQGLRNFGYEEDAKRVEQALLKAYAHFKTPVEVFVYKKGFRSYAHQNGAGACQVQAWSAASLVAVAGNRG
jgi:glycogen debranching enzyme